MPNGFWMFWVSVLLGTSSRSIPTRHALSISAAKRPRGILDQRYTNAYIYAAIEPGTDNNFVLILPDANTAGMQVFLDAFAATIAVDEHVALVVDGAGWHGSKSLNVPCNITL